MVDLRDDCSSFDADRAADQLLQHFGAAEDDAERVLQIVGDGAEHLVLEGVGALQPRSIAPARRWLAEVRSRVRCGDALLEAACWPRCSCS